LSAGGTIAGTPSSPGLFNFTVQVSDAASGSATRSLSIGVIVPLSISGIPPAGTTGVAYTASLSAVGGIPPYGWSVAGGQLPGGLGLDPSGGIISGTPARAGSFSVTIQLRDSGAGTVSATFTISVGSNLAILTPAMLASASAGSPYSQTLAATGGTPPYAWSLASGALPAGLTLDPGTGIIGGTPTQVGSFNLSVRVTDANANPAAAALTLTVASGLTIATAPVLPTATAGAPYSLTLQPAGGAAPYVWAVTAGSLPAGLTFHASGVIDGTPVAAGSFNFTVQVTDGNSTKADKQFSLQVTGPLTITTAPALPAGSTGAPYNQALAAAGGTPPYLWSITAGSPPAGLSLDASTGVLAGTPGGTGGSTFTVTVTDSGGIKAQKDFTIAIGQGISFTSPASLPNATAGTAYSFTLTGTGGQAPYSWSIVNGALPAGLTLNGTSGVISGTPSANGTFNFTVQVSDAGKLTATRVHTIVVGLPSAPSLSINGLASSVGPLEQPVIDVALSNPYPVAITGRLNLTFAPGGANPADDPSVQFSTGGRSAAFTIAANGTHAAFSAPQFALQAGSVAGTITVAVDSLAAGGASIAMTAPARTVQVNAAAPVIRSVTVNRRTGGFDVVVVALSTTRELTKATVSFHPSAAGALQTTQAAVPLTDVANAWFKGPDSAAFGGQFTLTLPFTITGGGNPLDSVSVVLSNGSGDSQALSAQY
jgi:hypothetical protein